MSNFMLFVLKKALDFTAMTTEIIAARVDRLMTAAAGISNTRLKKTKMELPNII